MLLDNDIIKFSLNNELYTLQLTDNPEMGLKVKRGKNIYYIATKEELINNLSENQEYNEENEIKIYAYMNDELVQLGVKENISELMIETISFTTSRFMMGSRLKTSNLGSYIEESNIKKEVLEIDYVEESKDNFVTEDITVEKDIMKPSLDGNLVSVEKDDLVYGYDNAFDFTTNDVIFSNYGNANLKPYQSEYDYVSIFYNNIDNFITNNDVDIVVDNLSLKQKQSTIERENYTFNDITNYALNETVQYGPESVGIEPEIITE